LVIALFGYGKMGRPMGRRLLAAGHELTVFDRDDSVLLDAVGDGAFSARSASSAAASSDLLITMLPDPAATEAVSAGEGGLLEGLGAGALWLEMSSSHPDLTRRLARAARARGADLLDAPVSGGVAGAAAGTLTVMVGGQPDLLDRARPVLEVLATDVIHVGDQAGDGDLAKTINNLLSAINLTAVSEALALGMKCGLDPVRLLEALDTGSGASRAASVKVPTFVLSGRFDSGFTINQMLKDLLIAREVATGASVMLEVGELVHRLWAALADSGHRADDHTTVAAQLAARAGIEFDRADRPT
jgi:3-hydroxyisobutyrate dehydrogenase-like beta-hydroxyacid dehydrogenase